MRRPLCVFCTGMLGVELVCAFLPQTELFVPFAAFFVALCLVLFTGKRTWRAGLCLLLGAAAGAAAVYTTDAGLERVRVQYAGRPLTVVAEVEKTAESYLPYAVDAVLHLEKVNGSAADFRVACAGLPDCEPGQRVRCRVELTPPAQRDRIDRCADGIALEGTYLGDFTPLVPGKSFRARTKRLQKRLSASLRRRMDGSTGGVLAAMTVGDRSYLPAALGSAYRDAGLSHVLVVSGMHVSVLCGELFGSLPCRERKERSYRRRRAKAVWAALLALLLVGVTGFTPSVRRAAVAVWVSSLGVWVYGAPDALTSLAAAGILMTAGNAYGVCDIGFELSFASVLGTLAGAECFRRLRESCRREKTDGPRRKRPSTLRKLAARTGWTLLEAVCISAGASLGAFPVLVLRGLSVSIWAVVSGMVVLWMVKPMMLLGLGTAFAGLLPEAEPVYGALSRAASFLTGLLDRWALWVSQKPGAGLYFDTAYAAVVCLVLLALGWLGMHWKLRLRLVVPCILLAATVSVGVGNALSRDLVHIDLVGSVNAPSVVVTRQDAALVLFRGGESARQAVENRLARRGVRKIELVVDLRLDPKTPCALTADTILSAADMEPGTGEKRRCAPAAMELLRTRQGCLVRLTVGNRQLVTLSGQLSLAAPVEAQWLLASPADPAAVRWQQLLSLGDGYRWMGPGQKGQGSSSLTLRRHGVLRAE